MLRIVFKKKKKRLIQHFATLVAVAVVVWRLEIKVADRVMAYEMAFWLTNPAPHLYQSPARRLALQ